MPQQVNWGIQDLSQSQPKTKIDLATPVNIYTALQKNKREQSLADLDLSTAQRKQRNEESISQIRSQFSKNPELAYNALIARGHIKAADDFKSEINAQAKQMQENQKRQQDMLAQQQTMAANKQKAFREQVDHNAGIIGPDYQEWAKLTPDVKQQSIGEIAGNFKDLGAKLPEWFEAEPYSPKHEQYMGMLAKRHQETSGTGADEKFFGNVINAKDENTGEIKKYVSSNQGNLKELQVPDGVEILEGTKVINLKDRTIITDESGNPMVQFQVGVDPAKAQELGFQRKKLEHLQSKEEREHAKWMANVNRERTKKGLKKAGTDLAAKTVVQDMGRGMHVLEKNMDGLITTAAGPIGMVMKRLPATDADVLERYAESVKSNISIDRLQAMREASPTGGALGQVPVQQQEYLMQLLGSLDVDQKPDILLDNMKRIYNIYMDAIHGIGNGPPRKRISFNEEGVPVEGGVEWDGTEFVDVIKTPQQVMDEMSELGDEDVDDWTGGPTK